MITVDQRNIEFLFQRVDCRGEGGLGNMTRGSRPSEMPFPGDSDKIFELAKTHGPSFLRDNHCGVHPTVGSFYRVRSIRSPVDQRRSERNNPLAARCDQTARQEMVLFCAK
jgi:hypothetical protein